MILAARMRPRADKSTWLEPRWPHIEEAGRRSSCKHFVGLSAVSNSSRRRGPRQLDEMSARRELARGHHRDAALVDVARARKTMQCKLGRGRDGRDTFMWPRPLNDATTTCDQRQLMVLSRLVGQLTLMLLLVLALAVSHSESFFIDERSSPRTTEWNYNEQLRWRQIHRDCGSGRAQSPIDIKHKNVIISQHLRLNFYNYDQQIKLKLSNAHHTVKMNPLGPAYDQDFEQHGGGNQRGAGLNSSSIHDIMTVDEYVEFTPNSNQRTSNGVDGGGASGGGGGTPVGGSNNDHMSRLIVGAARQAQDSHQQQMATAAASKPPDSVQRANNNRDHHANDIELERERNHGQTTSGFGAGLFGFHSTKEKVAYDGAPTIKLDWLDDGNNEYKLRDIHFHWGERRDNGSEHAIDGRRAAMEMHMVHIKHGLDKSSIGFTSDSVAVIAVLIESHRKSNLDFNPIVNELARINSTERAQEIDYKSLYDLLPNNLQAFYTYSGSLTTPPCYQVVNWIVMAERLNMNAKQIEMFRNLYAPPMHHKDEMASNVDETSHNNHQDHDEAAAGGNNEPTAGGGQELIMPNVRWLQPLNNRTILASFTKHGSRLESVTSSINSATGSAHFCIQLHLPIALAALIFQLTLWHTRLLELKLR